MNDTLCPFCQVPLMTEFIEIEGDFFMFLTCSCEAWKEIESNAKELFKGE